MSLTLDARTTPYPQRWAALAVILGAESLDLLDAAIMAVSAPTIHRELELGLPALQWIVAGYSLTMALGLITGGRLGDILGRRRMFLIGVAGFVATSLLCALAPGQEVLIVGRIVQGLFGAVLLPQGFGMIKAMFPPKEMVKALAMFGPAMGVSSICGPVLAGWLIDLDLFGLSWRTSFLITLPVGVLTLVMAMRLLPADPVRTGAPRPRMVAPGSERPRLDVPGMLLAGAGSLLIIYPVIQGGERGWPWWTAGMIASGLAVYCVFAAWVRRSRFPLVEPSLFRKRAYSGGLLIVLIFSGLLAAFAHLLTLLTQLDLGYTPTQAGLAIAPVSAGIVIGSLGGFRLARMIGRRTLHLGLIVTGVGLATLVTMLPDPGQSPWHLVPGVLIVGLGMGLMIAPLFSFILADVDEHEVGSASGVLTAVQQLGSALGVALLGTLFLTGSFAASTFAMGGALAITFALVFLLPEQSRQEAE